MTLKTIFTGATARQLYWPTAICAAVVRLFAFGYFLESPLRRFHQVPGLDMQTLLYYGAWDFQPVRPVFTLHRSLVALVWGLNGRVHSVEVLAAVQLFCGVAVALLTAYAALHLWGGRKKALAAGLIAAFYGPALMYELSMLQETLQLTAFAASFAGMIWARKHRFRSWRGVFCGALLALASIGRPVALLWVLAALAWSFFALRRHRETRNILLPAAGVMAVWLMVGLGNFAANGNPSPFFNVFGYSASVNAAAPVAAEVAAVSGGEGASGRLFRIGWNAVGRVPLLFMAHEIPDNLNYYFIRDHFVPLQCLPGPGLLVPFALAGVVLSLRFFRRDSLILLALCSLALPLCANYPMGRYRLILLPLFALLAVEVWRFAMLRPRKFYCCGALLVLCGAFLVNPLPPERFWRASDLVAWGTALELPAGTPTPESVAAFAEAYRLTGDQAAAVNLVIRLVTLREFAAAGRVIDDALARGTVNPSLMNYYAALMLMEERKFAEAEERLKACSVAELDTLAVKYYFLRGEAARRQGRIPEARGFFRRSLEAPGFPEFKPMVERALSMLPDE